MATEDSEEYLAVLKASYDYEPQSDEEIAIKEDQLLFLLHRTDQDWWKVKIKGESQEEVSPSGLVPAAYVEQARHTSVVKALYDYEANAAGELSVKEGDVLLVFDKEDAWLLVQSQAEGGNAGFVPENYVEATTNDLEEEPAAPGGIVVPPSPPRPVSTYVDPADRVASTKATADDIKTWSVSEIDKKGKKKKGTLGIGNGAVFFASDSDKTPVQKWQIVDIGATSIEKSKHVHIEVGGSAPISLHFNAGSKDTAEAIITKLQSSKALSATPRPSISSQSEVPHITASPPPALRHPDDLQKSSKIGASVRFAPTSPTVIPRSPSVEEYAERESELELDPEAEDERGAHLGAVHTGEDTADALYDFDADGEDELSVKEGEHLVIVEKDSDEWWKCRNSEGAEGVVPASYLEVTSTGSHNAVTAVAMDDGPEDEAEREAEEQRAAEERAEVSRIAHEQAEKQRAEKERKKHEQASRARAAAASAETDRKRREKEKAAEAEAERKRRQEAKRAEDEAKRVEQATAEKSERRSSSRPNGESSASSRTPDGKRGAPPTEKTRIWHDRSGQFRVEAAFLGFNGGKLRLHKVNGVVIEVPSEKMSTEDMRYIEKVTYKRASGTPNMSDDDIPLAQQRKQLNISRSTTPKKGPMIDWFEFFLSAGCDVDDCTRYASSFERDKIDEAILPDITDATMRSLGLREGDIIRVTKAIEQRHPKKPDASAQEQLLGDEAMARQLQEEERSGKKRTSPAPNLFAAGPGGALKQPRRGRPQSNKNGPASTVDLNAINTASDNIQRTSSPQALSPASTPVQAPPRSSSALAPVVSSGFDDEAWTPRPSSTKPLAPTPPVVTARAPSAPPVSAPPAAITVSPPAQPQNSGSSLAKTTESDIFDQLSRLSQLRPAASPAVSSTAFNHNSPPAASPPLASYHSGLGMGSSPIPIGQHVQNQQSGLLAPQQNGPRGPYAPVLANQSLLQPLIPTTSVLNSFVPTRPGAIQGQPQQSFISSQITGFPNSPQPMMQQPTGFPSMGPMLPQPTGMAGTNYSGFGTTPSFQNNGSFSGVQINPTGFNTGFGQSPFNRLASPPPVPPLPSSTSNNISPANIFAQMKSGTFASGNEHGPQPQEKYDALRPNPLSAQATGWGNPTNGFQGAYPGYR